LPCWNRTSEDICADVGADRAIASAVAAAAARARIWVFICIDDLFDV
jgi:hypothetical protein